MSPGQADLLACVTAFSRALEGAALPEMEKQAVVEALRRAKGNKSQAATALGLSRTRFYTLLRRCGSS
jgi:two-component system NtrC family response regulator